MTAKKKSFLSIVVFLLFWGSICHLSFFEYSHVSAEEQTNTTSVIKEDATQFSNSFIGLTTAHVTKAKSTTQQVATPTFNPAAGAFTTHPSITISCSTSGAVIRYTTYGAEPTSSSPQYNGPIPVYITTTIKAKAFKYGWADSNTATATYTIGEVVATPVFSPAEGTYTGTQNITISDSTAGTVIRYTTNGSEPTAASAQYTSPIAVSSSMTLKAKAFKSGLAESATASAAYTIGNVAAAPAFSPAGGIFSSHPSVTISSTTAGATIRYTTNGSEPTLASAQYTAPITIMATMTLKAKAFKAGFTESSTASSTYTIGDVVATPTFSPDGGTFTAHPTVTINCSTSGAIIRYTTYGTEPTESSPQYTGPIPIYITTTLKAKAFKVGFTDSSTVSATYTIQQ